MKRDRASLLSYVVDSLTVCVEDAQSAGERKTAARLKRAREEVLTVAIGPGCRPWWRRWRR